MVKELEKQRLLYESVAATPASEETVTTDTTRSAATLWQAIIGAVIFLFVATSVAHADSFTPPCLDRVPVPLEECFDEFVASGIQDKQAWFRFVESVKDRIFLNQEKQQIRVHASRPERVLYSYTLPRDVPADSEQALVLRELRREVEVPYLSSGGWINILTLNWFLPGHSDITKAILEKDFSFRLIAQLIAGDAAQDPDFYDWKRDAAHAQTGAEADGRARDRAAAFADFVKWVSDLLKTVKAECAQGRTQYALYWLGYALHAVQDLAAHNGRTFFEHAWNSYCDNPDCDSTGRRPKDGDPDEDPASIERARQYTREFLKLTKDLVGLSCWIAMKHYTGDPVTTAEKTGSLDLRWDLTPASVRQYRQSRFVFAARRADGDYVVRWIPSVVAVTVLWDRILTNSK